MSTPAHGFFPWHADLARHWLQARDRFAHAWLLHGLAGTGKRQFARAAAASLLCEAPEHGLACGHCASCVWVHKGHHPDLRLIRPDAMAQEEADENIAETTQAETAQAETDSKPASKSKRSATQESTGSAAKKTLSKEIRIDQLRALHDWFNTTTHRAGWRVAVLYPAQALNLICANALLKVLEEPPPHTIFLIVADAPDRLLPTLVSRCRRLPLPVPPRETVLPWLHAQHLAQPQSWLDASGGAPLHALALSRELPSACPDWLQQWAQAVQGTMQAANRSAHRSNNQPGSGPDYLLLAEALETIPPARWLDTLQRFFIDLQCTAHGLPPRYFPALAALAQALTGAPETASPTTPHIQKTRQTLSHAAKWLAQQTRLANHPLNARLFAYKVLQHLGQACLNPESPRSF